MTINLFANRVLETAPAPGSGQIVTLGGAVAGRMAFHLSGFTDQQQVAFWIDDGVQSEHCVGVYSAAGSGSLSRDAVLWNSRELYTSPSKLNFSSAVQVYCETSAQLAPAVFSGSGSSFSFTGASNQPVANMYMMATGVNLVGTATFRAHFDAGSAKTTATQVHATLTGYQNSGDTADADYCTVSESRDGYGVPLTIQVMRNGLIIGRNYFVTFNVTTASPETIRIETPVIRLMTF